MPVEDSPVDPGFPEVEKENENVFHCQLKRRQYVLEETVLRVKLTTQCRLPRKGACYYFRPLPEYEELGLLSEGVVQLSKK